MKMMEKLISFQAHFPLSYKLHDYLHILIAPQLTYLIDWRAANKYPVLIIFYINGCFLIASIGFMVQFHPGVRQDLTCRSDGTLRQAEPR